MWLSNRFLHMHTSATVLDQISLPDFTAGATENWGLITFRETALLYDWDVSSNGDKEWVASVVAHELSTNQSNYDCQWLCLVLKSCL